MDDRYWAVYWKPMRKDTLSGEGAEELNWTKHRSSAAPWRGRLLRAESIRTGYLRARLRHDHAQHRYGVGIIDVPPHAAGELLSSGLWRRKVTASAAKLRRS